MTKVQGNKLLAEAYYNLALPATNNMRLMSDMLETIRPALDNENPYETWERLNLNTVQFTVPDDVLIVLKNLKTDFYSAVFQNIKEEINEEIKSNEPSAFQKWINAYADALGQFRCEVYELLVREDFPFSLENIKEQKQYSRLNKLILEDRWFDALPEIENLLNKKFLPPAVKTNLLVISGQIHLHHSSNINFALQQFEEAKATDPDSLKAEKGFAYYYMKLNETDKAKNILAQAITKYPNDYDLYILMGDCYINTKETSTAEQWYYDAININFLQPDPYARLIRLYDSEEKLAEIDKDIPGLLHKIELLESCPAYNNSYYNALRDVAVNYYNNLVYDKAEEWYRKAIGLKPDYVSAYVDIVYVLIRVENYEEAEAMLKRGLQHDAEAYDLHLALAYLYEQKGEYEKAIEVFNKCLQLRQVGKDKVFNLLGNLFLKKEEYDKAIEQYRKAIEENPYVSVYADNLCDALLKQGKIYQNNDQFEDGEKIFLSLAATTKYSYDVNSVGNFYYYFRLFDKAEEYYKKAIVLDRTIAVFHENLGLSYEGREMYVEAEASYLKAVELAGDSGSAHNKLGYIYDIQQKHSLAIEQYRLALEKEPENETYLSNLSRTYYAISDYPRAEEVLAKWVAVQPGNPDAWNNMGLMQYFQKDYDNAEKNYLKAVSLNENHVYFENLALLYRNTGKPEEAIKYYEKVISLKPDLAIYYNDLGVLYFEQNMYDRAKEYYHKAIELSPGTALYHQNLGLLYYALFDYDSARSEYKKATELDSSLSHAFNYLGNIEYETGNFQDAVNNYQKAIAVNATEEVYQQNLNLALSKITAAQV